MAKTEEEKMEAVPSAAEIVAKEEESESKESPDQPALPPLPEGERFVGHCKWFNVLKGFGFIIRDDNEEEVFVHQSELQMKGFRSLENGARVAFSLRAREGKDVREAWHVTAEKEGEELLGSSVRPLGKKKNTLIRCYKCGTYGNHVAARCRKVDGDVKVCYECQSMEHLVADCPLRVPKTPQVPAPAPAPGYSSPSA